MRPSICYWNSYLLRSLSMSPGCTATRECPEENSTHISFRATKSRRRLVCLKPVPLPITLLWSLREVLIRQGIPQVLPERKDSQHLLAQNKNRIRLNYSRILISWEILGHYQGDSIYQTEYKKMTNLCNYKSKSWSSSKWIRLPKHSMMNFCCLFLVKYLRINYSRDFSKLNQ